MTAPGITQAETPQTRRDPKKDKTTRATQRSKTPLAWDDNARERTLHLHKPAAETSITNHSNLSSSKRRRLSKESRKPVSDKDSKPSAPGATSSTWKDCKEWLKGVPDTLQKERTDKGLCTRCSRRDHKWYHCTGKIVVAVASSTAAASEGGKKKRKRKQG